MFRIVCKFVPFTKKPVMPLQTKSRYRSLEGANLEVASFGAYGLGVFISPPAAPVRVAVWLAAVSWARAVTAGGARSVRARR